MSSTTSMTPHCQTVLSGCRAEACQELPELSPGCAWNNEWAKQVGRVTIYQSKLILLGSDGAHPDSNSAHLSTWTTYMHRGWQNKKNTCCQNAGVDEYWGCYQAHCRHDYHRLVSVVHVCMLMLYDCSPLPVMMYVFICDVCDWLAQAGREYLLPDCACRAIAMVFDRQGTYGRIFRKSSVVSG